MAVKKSPARSKTSTKTAKKSAAAGSARTASAKSESLSLTSVSPGLTVNDIESSIAWYRDVLGFKLKERWERDGKLLGAGMVAGKTSFMLGQDDWKKGRDRVKGQGVRMYCITGQDIDRLAAKIEARGGTLTQEPKDQEWGMRDIAIEDPDGYKITIAAELKKKR